MAATAAVSVEGAMGDGVGGVLAGKGTKAGGE